MQLDSCQGHSALVYLLFLKEKGTIKTHSCVWFSLIVRIAYLAYNFTQPTFLQRLLILQPPEKVSCVSKM